MKVGIMQPYFLPYVGYFQLINSVDKFVIYDNIEYTKKGWINRNRIILNRKEELISLPLKKDSDFLSVCERKIAESFYSTECNKLIRRITESYKKAPFFNDTFLLFEEILSHKDQNLFNFIYNSLVKICDYLAITTEIIKSSDLVLNQAMKGEAKVLNICKVLNASTYVNAIGGMSLYQTKNFEAEGLELKFIQSKPLVYQNFSEPFVPWLSILDLMMHIPKADLQGIINNNYELITNSTNESV